MARSQAASDTIAAIAAVVKVGPNKRSAGIGAVPAFGAGAPELIAPGRQARVFDQAADGDPGRVPHGARLYFTLSR